ncbi:hypothetical protein ATO10_15385 [Actibacterium atlanticum]|uniref:Uncharacterized protein n=1 Tax=Actibacterium atlanticum TaxID=1461693 RepID=A0A058ZGV4_9RHOB|nr:hypothetical protein [Actibacterium atlanticum]KCV80818.1 hypothetical protein ATO10_15385 [Actibacterium atlanticum]
MSFIRPEIAARLSRYQETLLAVVMVLIGLRIYAFGGFVLQGVGGIITLVSVAWAVIALRRARFPTGKGGQGVVEVDERQITYLSPVDGGMASIDLLVQVEIETNSASAFAPDLHWVFHSDGMPLLRIPGNAAGIDALFDVLSALPGADFGKAAEAASSTRNAKFVIWQKDRRKLH